MSTLDDCLAALISTIETESGALARQDHTAAASLLGIKTTLSAELQRHLTSGPSARQPSTASLAARLMQAIATNRAHLERSIRVRRHMLGLLRQTVRPPVTSALYSRSGRSRLDTRMTPTTFATRA